MKFYSTNHTGLPVSFEEAIFNSLPADNGLYFPEELPKLDASWIRDLVNKSKTEIAFEISLKFAGSEIPASELEQICAETIDFDFPVVEVEPGIYALELYHGPTWAFKDVGARFLSRCMAHFNQQRGRKVTILVATSGDTGGAVAAGFHGVEGVEVKILFPKGKVSELQQKQLTTWGDNVKAYEVAGTFDDCQRLVKRAFLDKELNDLLNLSSANSINIARLIPQSFYYFYGRQALEVDPVISVPSGNYGNLSAGLLAWKMGLPIGGFIAASNRNQIVPDYLETGLYAPRPSVQTLANAMDVGDPSNFVRLKEIFQSEHQEITKWITGFHLDDDGIIQTIRECYDRTGYLLDPHGAIGYQALKTNLPSAKTGLFLETAHPVKFLDVVERSLGKTLDYSSKITAVMAKESAFTSISTEFNDFRDCLI